MPAAATRAGDCRKALGQAARPGQLRTLGAPETGVSRGVDRRRLRAWQAPGVAIAGTSVVVAPGAALFPHAGALAPQGLPALTGTATMPLKPAMPAAFWMPCGRCRRSRDGQPGGPQTVRRRRHGFVTELGYPPSAQDGTTTGVPR